MVSILYVWVKFISHWCCISLMILFRKTSLMVSKSIVNLGDQFTWVLVLKVFLTKGQTNVLCYDEWRYKNKYLWLTWRISSNVKGLTLEGEILLNSSVSISPTKSRNEKVEQHIRIKTYNLITLKFWVRGSFKPLYVSWAYVSLMLYFTYDHFSKDPVNSI